MFKFYAIIVWLQDLLDKVLGQIGSKVYLSWQQKGPIMHRLNGVNFLVMKGSFDSYLHIYIYILLKFNNQFIHINLRKVTFMDISINIHVPAGIFLPF